MPVLMLLILTVTDPQIIVAGVLDVAEVDQVAEEDEMGNVVMEEELQDLQIIDMNPMDHLAMRIIL